jgi:uncharacterized membrane protein YraQ (UPF0718 family)
MKSPRFYCDKETEMNIVMAFGHVLRMAFTMLWDIFWGLSLGFLFSAVIEVAVSKGEMSRLLPDASAKSIVKASLLGAASSSCSYAAFTCSVGNVPLAAVLWERRHQLRR